MLIKKRRKLKLTKESLKRLGTNHLTLVKGGTDDTWDGACDTAMIDCITDFPSVDELCF